MKKIFFRSILLVLIISLISIIYLSIFGFETEKFNNQISNQIKKIDKNLEIELKKVNILLDLYKFEIIAKTFGTNLKYKDKIIQVESIKSSLSLSSLIKKKPPLTNLNIATKSVDIKNLISFMRLFKNDGKLFIAEQLVKKGYVVANINIEFDNEGKIKKNYEVKGYVKDGKINLFNKYDLTKIDFSFNLNLNTFKINDIALHLNDNFILFPNIKGKKEGNKFLISGIVNNKKLLLNKDNLGILLNQNNLNIKIDKIEFASENFFSFEINDKFKVKNLQINSKINLYNLIMPNQFNLIKIFPKLNKEIQFENHLIKLEYDKENLNINGLGNIRLQTESDEIEYNIIKTKKDLDFETKFIIIKNQFKLDFLNYQKEPDTNLEILIKGNKALNKSFFFSKISLKEKTNSFLLSDLLLSNNYEIEKLSKISLDYIDKENLKNKVQIKRKNKDYILDGETLNLNKIIKDILKSKKRNKKNFFKDTLKIKLNIKKVNLDKESDIQNLKGFIVLKNNHIIDAKLESNFLNGKKIIFSVKSNDNEKITTLFSEYPKPLIKRYKFIKGFDKGILNFYSVKKKDISNSILVIDNFKIKEVPVLAKILTLASLQGIADLLTGEGIRFTDFEMKFSNKKDLMTIDEMYSIGPAISILLEGYIEKDKIISLKGTLVPATTINRTIASIPIIGDILVGKKVGEGVFGVSFKIKGPPNNLETVVNPIKTLTPRFITRTLEKIKKN